MGTQTVEDLHDELMQHWMEDIRSGKIKLGEGSKMFTVKNTYKEGVGELIVEGEFFAKDKAGALEQSIEKWTVIVEALISGKFMKIIDGGDGTCALCRLFANEFCDGCPVKEKTDHSRCSHTPYFDYIGATESLDDAGREIRLICAKRELAFLESLREEKWTLPRMAFIAEEELAELKGTIEELQRLVAKHENMLDEIRSKVSDASAALQACDKEVAHENYGYADNHRDRASAILDSIVGGGKDAKSV